MKLVKIILTFFLTILLFQPVTTLAFKPKTHVWIAQQVLNDVLPDGKVSINGKEYLVDSDVVNALKNYQNEYRMGFVGPDTFPDIVVGQMTVHPGNPQNDTAWQSDDWLKMLLISSKDNSRMKSFAYGYLGHAASDIFAHTYVNTYAGDIFEILDCKSIECAPGTKGRRQFAIEEARHFALGSFIAKYTPSITDQNVDSILDVPAEDVKKSLVLNPEVLKQYKDKNLLSFTGHILFMTEYKKEIEDLIKTSSQSSTEDIENLKKIKLTEKTKIDSLDTDIEKLEEKISTLKQQISDNKNKKAQQDLKKAESDLKKTNSLKAKQQKRINKINEDIADLENKSAKLQRDLEQWLDNVDEAITEYINMSGKVGVALVEDSDIMIPIYEWRDNYAKYFLPTPLEKIVTRYQEEVEKIKKLWGIRWLVKLNKYIDEKVDKLKKRANIFLARIFLSKQAEEFLKLIYYPNINDKQLNNIFSEDKTGKNLLLIPDIAERVKKDMSIIEGDIKVEREFFDPDKFHAVYNSIVLSKLTLLSPEQLNQLIRDNYPESGVFFKEDNLNILIGAVRSIDGNHQWSEYAPPYLRRNGVVDNRPLEKRRYGRENGFTLWADPQLREKVFQKIFRGPLVTAMEVPESFNLKNLIPECYPYNPNNMDPFPKILNVSEKINCKEK